MSLPPEHKSTVAAFIEGKDVSPAALEACADWWADAHAEDTILVSHFRSLADPDATVAPDIARSVYYEIADSHPSALPNPLPDDAQEDAVSARLRPVAASDFRSPSLSTRGSKAAFSATVNDEYFGQLHTAWLLHEISGEAEDSTRKYAVHSLSRELPAWVGEPIYLKSVTFGRGRGFPMITIELDDGRDCTLSFALAHAHTESGQLLFESAKRQDSTKHVLVGD